MATQEELQALANQEIEDAKPMYAQVNNERREFTDAEYAQAKTDLGNSKWDAQQFGYVQARQEAYGSVQNQLDMQFWDNQKNTTVWIDHIAQVKSDNPKPA